MEYLKTYEYYPTLEFYYAFLKRYREIQSEYYQKIQHWLWA